MEYVLLVFQHFSFFLLVSFSNNIGFYNIFTVSFHADSFVQDLSSNFYMGSVKYIQIYKYKLSSALFSIRYLSVMKKKDLSMEVLNVHQFNAELSPQPLHHVDLSTQIKHGVSPQSL